MVFAAYVQLYVVVYPSAHAAPPLGAKNIIVRQFLLFCCVVVVVAAVVQKIISASECAGGPVSPHVFHT